MDVQPEAGCDKWRIIRCLVLKSIELAVSSSMAITYFSFNDKAVIPLAISPGLPQSSLWVVSNISPSSKFVCRRDWITWTVSS